MIEIDKSAARSILSSLPMTSGNRRFADFWLSRLVEDGSGEPHHFSLEATADILTRVVTFEITPRTVRFHSAGKAIVEGLGMNVRGRDYLAMAPIGQRATRLARMCKIVEGHSSQHQRWVVNTAGKIHFLNELAFPCGLSENGLPMIMTHVDADSFSSIGHIPIDKGAMNVAPVFNTYAIA
jgi:hypothetical protein